MYNSEESIMLEYKAEGDAKFKSNDFIGAAVCYELAIKASSRPLPELFFNLGLTCEKLNKSVGEVIHYFETALLLKPDYEKASVGIKRMENKMDSMLLSTTNVFAAGSQNNEITILDFARPAYLYLNGDKKPLAEVEKIMGKTFCNRLTIDKVHFAGYQKYCREKTILKVFATQLKHPDPLPSHFFDIRDMKPFGYGLFLREPVKAGTVLTYYFGKIVPGEGATDYALGFGEAKNRYDRTVYVVDFHPNAFTLAGLMQHLPDGNDLSSDKSIRFQEANRIATENLNRISVHLLAKEGEQCGVIVTPLIAQRDLIAGEIIGFSYTSGVGAYWENRSLWSQQKGLESISPAYFDQTGQVMKLAAPSDESAQQPERPTYSNAVKPRVFPEETTLLEVSDSVASGLQGEAKLKATIQYIEYI